jgi:hypothetical protein
MFATMPMNGPQARQIRCSGSFDLDCNADTAFPFFSPEGEREWVKSWNPTPVFPAQIAFEPDTVFCEGAGVQPAIWTIVEVDWQAHSAEYVRFAPESHSAHITVEVEAAGSSHSQVVVSYVITAFGEDQTRLLEAFSEAAYAAKMCEWKQRITACLARR